MNYGEEVASLYLRLNGFFLLPNFVIHRSSRVRFTSDADLLAIRTPHVYEEIGGNDGDWDPFLASRLMFGRSIGVICEVKTGAFDEAKLFRRQYVQYAVGRLGLIERERISQVTDELITKPLIEIDRTGVICKLLICDKERESEAYINRGLAAAEQFLADRVSRYPQEKFADRMFFPSKLFQFVIAQVHREIEKRASAA